MAAHRPCRFLIVSSLGGPYNLRGFENRDVGPRDGGTNEVLGGNTSAYVSIEYTFPIAENIRGAAFYDIGSVNAGLMGIW